METNFEASRLFNFSMKHIGISFEMILIKISIQYQNYIIETEQLNDTLILNR